MLLNLPQRMEGPGAQTHLAPNTNCAEVMLCPEGSGQGSSIESTARVSVSEGLPGPHRRPDA